jgi:hypothetical protein
MYSTLESPVLVLQKGGDSGGFAGGMVGLAFVFTFVAGMWKFFVKAGQPGWAVFVPIYNTIVLLKIAGRPGWWLLLALIPFVNIWMIFRVSIDIAHSFEKSTGFGIGLAMLSPIFYMVLGFGSSEYQGPSVEQN